MIEVQLLVKTYEPYHCPFQRPKVIPTPEGRLAAHYLEMS